MGVLRKYHIIKKNICCCMPYICEERISEVIIKNLNYWKNESRRSLKNLNYCRNE